MTPSESFAAHRDRVIEEVRGEWPYADDYAAFIGPRCPECSRRGCNDLEHLEAVRAGVERTMTIRELAAVLGVEPQGANRATV